VPDRAITSSLILIRADSRCNIDRCFRRSAPRSNAPEPRRSKES